MSEQSETAARPGLLRQIGIVVATILGFTVASILIPSVTVIVSPTGAVWLGVAGACVALLALVWPLHMVKLGHRGVSTGVLIVALLTAGAGYMMISHKQDEMLAALKQDEMLAALRESDPAAYLAKLREVKGDDAWLPALKAIDPGAYEAEMARRTAELRKQREAEERERQAAKAREEAKVCNDKVSAWTMAEQMVEAQLRAPSTADFPWYREEWVRPTGDCSFTVTGYVDAQNGFGAMIRSNWVVVLTYIGDDRWRRDSISIK